MKTGYLRRAIGVSVLGLALGGTQALAQSNAGDYRIGGFLGGTDRVDMDFTYGVEFEYHPGSVWSYGAVVEHTSNVIRGGDATVLFGTANFRPATMPRLKLIGGLGGEFRDYASDGIRFRAGTGYDLVVEGNLVVTPRVTFDFGDGRNSVVLGATAFYRF